MIVIFPSEKAVPFEDGNGTQIWGHPFHPQAPCYCCQREDGKWTVVQDLQSRGVMDDIWVQSGTATRIARLSIPPDMKFVEPAAAPNYLEGFSDGDTVENVLLPETYLSEGGIVKFAHHGVAHEWPASLFRRYASFIRGCS